MKYWIIIFLFVCPTAFAECHVNGALPDAACTPGDVLAVTPAEICVPGYTKTVRNVPEAVKKQVYAQYGITEHPKGSYEVDHLISLQLGGSNDIKNLWPQAALPKPGFHEKDGFENHLHSLICQGKLDLKVAQEQIRSNWLSYWELYNEPNNNAGTVTAEAGQP